MAQLQISPQIETHVPHHHGKSSWTPKVQLFSAQGEEQGLLDTEHLGENSCVRIH